MGIAFTLQEVFVKDVLTPFKAVKVVMMQTIAQNV